ncbi:50S ribosomal protein L35ae [Candidatus Woesearchaeota archaeon]|nr:50S ribosomal protein L35ae [Candidatus Woesearchaeota archaeon]
MEGLIKNFRMGRHRQTDNQMVLILPAVSKKDQAAKLVGKTVTWTTPGNKAIKGKITAPHGNSGAVRVLFEKGMPGQAVGKKVKVE